MKTRRNGARSRIAIVLAALMLLSSLFAAVPAAVNAAEGDANLVVTNITWTPENPQPGEEVTFSATVKNIGTDASRNAIVGVRFDIGQLGNYVSWSDNTVASIPAGGELTVTANGGPNNKATWTAGAKGTTQVIAWVDDQNRIPESNTGDNQLTKSLEIGKEVVVPSEPCDLAISELRAEIGTLYKNDQTKLVAFVKNESENAAGAFKVSYSVDGRTVDTVTYTGGIAAGGTAVVVSGQKWTSAFGTHTLRAEVNPDSTLPETNTDNNKRLGLIKVKDETRPVIPTEPTSAPATDPTTPPTTQPPTQPPVIGDDIILNGDESGASALIGDWSYYSGWTGYDYAGFATLKDADLTSYRYLQITYTGDITYLRLEFEKAGQKPPVKSPVTWFNPEQAVHFATTDGSAIKTVVSTPTTIVIDLQASGIDLSKGFDGVHLHYGDDAEASNGFVITDARLKTSASSGENPTTPPIQPTNPVTPTDPTTPVDPDPSATVKAYAVPAGKSASSAATLSVDGKNVGVFDTRVNHARSWSGYYNPSTYNPVAIFDFSGTVTVKVELNRSDVNSVTIRPLNHLKPQITHQNGKTQITFQMSTAAGAANAPGQYTLEFNGNSNDTLHLFASKIEAAPTGNVITIASGTSRDGDIYLGSGQTLYIEGGAALYGRVHFASNSKLVGRGIVDGSKFNTWGGSNGLFPIDITGVSNVEVSGVSILDSNCWNCEVRRSSQVRFNNIKIVSARPNGDGISIQSSDNVYIDNSFIRTWDDGIVVKNYASNNSHDIYANNCVLWTDLAQSMEIGVETNAGYDGYNASPKIYNVEFKNIDVIHAMHKAPISIHNGDNAEIYNIKWENIVIEDLHTGQGDGWALWLDFTNVTADKLGNAGWTHNWARGTVHDIYLTNISVVENKSVPTDGSGFRIWANNGSQDMYNWHLNNAYTWK